MQRYQDTSEQRSFFFLSSPSSQRGRGIARAKRGNGIMGNPSPPSLLWARLISAHSHTGVEPVTGTLEGEGVNLQKS